MNDSMLPHPGRVSWLANTVERSVRRVDNGECNMNGTLKTMWLDCWSSLIGLFTRFCQLLTGSGSSETLPETLRPDQRWQSSPQFKSVDEINEIIDAIKWESLSQLLTLFANLDPKNPLEVLRALLHSNKMQGQRGRLLEKMSTRLAEESFQQQVEKGSMPIDYATFILELLGSIIYEHCPRTRRERVIHEVFDKGALLDRWITEKGLSNQEVTHLVFAISHDWEVLQKLLAKNTRGVSKIEEFIHQGLDVSLYPAHIEKMLEGRLYACTKKPMPAKKSVEFRPYFLQLPRTQCFVSGKTEGETFQSLNDEFCKILFKYGGGIGISADFCPVSSRFNMDDVLLIGPGISSEDEYFAGAKTSLREYVQLEPSLSKRIQKHFFEVLPEILDDAMTNLEDLKEFFKLITRRHSQWDSREWIKEIYHVPSDEKLYDVFFRRIIRSNDTSTPGLEQFMNYLVKKGFEQKTLCDLLIQKGYVGAFINDDLLSPIYLSAEATGCWDGGFQILTPYFGLVKNIFLQSTVSSTEVKTYLNTPGAFSGDLGTKEIVDLGGPFQNFQMVYEAMAQKAAQKANEAPPELHAPQPCRSQWDYAH